MKYQTHIFLGDKTLCEQTDSAPTNLFAPGSRPTGIRQTGGGYYNNNNGDNNNIVCSITGKMELALPARRAKITSSSVKQNDERARVGARVRRRRRQ